MGKLDNGFFSARAIVIFTLFLCISPQATLLHAQKTVKLRIDPTYARGGTVSQIFDSVRYIPLETSKESTFGDIRNLQVSQHYFVFFDEDTKDLLIFEKNGKYHSRIKELPMKDWDKEQDSRRFFSFVIDAKTENIFILYNDKTKERNKWLTVFNADGKVILHRKLPDIMRDMSSRFAIIDSNKAIFSYKFPQEGKNDSLAKYHFFIIQNFDSIVSPLLPVNPQDPLVKRYWNASYYLGLNGFWTRQSDYTLYHIDKDGKPVQYRFLFPQNLSLDSAFYMDSTLDIARADLYFRKYPDRISVIDDVARTGNLLSFRLQKSVNYVGIRDKYVFSLKTGTLYALDKISSDSLSYFLPVSRDWGYFFTGQNCIYYSIPSFLMFQGMESREEKLWKRDPVLKKYFTTENRKSNPVLVELKLKDNL